MFNKLQIEKKWNYENLKHGEGIFQQLLKNKGKFVDENQKTIEIK